MKKLDSHCDQQCVLIIYNLEKSLINDCALCAALYLESSCEKDCYSYENNKFIIFITNI